MYIFNKSPFSTAVITVLFVLLLGCTNQISNKSIIKNTPPDLSNIALINEVWYEDNQQYIHPSFTYAGTGFLINTDQGVVAATAKHVLLIANPKGMKGVSPNAHLEKWIMHPKQNKVDSVVIGQLLNEDTNEVLGFGNASIQIRDWIVFATKYHSPNIKALTPRFSPLKEGELIYFTGCPYKKDSSIIEKATVLSVKGNRIIFSKEDKAANIGGASGSPLIDASGKLVGVLSGTSVSPKDGQDALFGISTNYLKKILTGDKDLNKAVLPIDEFLDNTITNQGIDVAITKYKQLKKEANFYFDYQVSPEGLNTVAEKLLTSGKTDDALRILDLNLKEHAFFSDTYNLIGKANLAKNEIDLAKKALTEALRLWPESEAAQKTMKALEEMKSK